MKNVFLLRHAKSSWKHSDLLDIERPLNKRGKRDAFIMAENFLKRNIELDLIAASSAKRTLDTAKVFAEVLQFKGVIVEDDDLYGASSNIILKSINQIEDNISNALVVCHNPGITNLANELSDIFIENIPTSGLVGFSADCNWKRIKQKNCTFLFFDYPKK